MPHNQRHVCKINKIISIIKTYDLPFLLIIHIFYTPQYLNRAIQNERYYLASDILTETPKLELLVGNADEDTSGVLT